MTFFRRLAFLSTAATLILIAIGGLVRATKSGLGCGTDWPDCGGQLLPEIQSRAQAIELSHRLAASVVVVLLALLALTAVRKHRDDRRILWGSVGAFGTVLLQAGLGAVVVKLELAAASVVLHLGVALSLLALLIYVSAAASRTGATEVASDEGIARRASVTAGFVLALLLLGSYVSGTGAGLVFPDWPLMNGQVIPDLSHELRAIHFAHRAFAAVTGVVVAMTAIAVIRRKAELPLQAKLAHAVGGLFFVEVLIGAANVWTELNAAFVSLHLFIGAVIWAGLVALAVVSRPQPAARREVVRGRTALEGGRT